MTDEEIEKMVKDAEAHAEEDHKARELVEARNMAENLVHATRKSMQELGDKVGEAEKNEIESAIADVEEAIKGNDKSAIESKAQKLSEVAGKLAERVYKEQAENTTTAAGGGGDAADANADSGSDKENVVDAEFEEVDDDKK